MKLFKLKDEINSEALFKNIKYSKQNSIGRIRDLRISFDSILQNIEINNNKMSLDLFGTFEEPYEVKISCTVL